MIANADLDALAVCVGVDGDGLEIRLDLGLSRILDGVVDEIGDRLPDEVTVRVDDDTVVDVDVESEARFFRDRLIELGDVAYELAEIEALGATAIAVVMLLASFVLLLTINLLQWWSGRRHSGVGS